MKTDSRKYAIYSRKSKYTGKGESVENQIEICKKHLQTKYNVDIEQDIIVYEDEGFTGANTKRPNFQKMLCDIRANKIATVICYRLDRVSRNVLDFCTLKDEFTEYNVSFISVREDFDTSTPMGTAMLLIASVFAQLERDTIAERIRDNQTELAKTGRWLGGTTPTGFKSDEIEKISVDGKKKKLCKLTPIPEEKQLVVTLYNKYVEYKSLTQLETYCVQNNLKSKNGVALSRFALKHILINPVYAVADKDILQYFKDRNVDIYAEEEQFDGKFGMMVYNKTSQKTGKTTRARDIEDWIVAIGKHKGFISGQKWVYTQELLTQNESKRYRKPIANNAVLAGIIYCADCGSHMRPKIYQAVDEDGNRSFGYMCELKEKSRCKMCSSKNVYGVELDKEVYRILKENLNSGGELYQAIKEIAKGTFDGEDNQQQALQTLNRTKKQNEKSIQLLLEKLALIDISLMNEVTAEIKRLKEANTEIDKQIESLDIHNSENMETVNNAQIVLHILNSYFSTFDELDLQTRRLLMRMLVHSVYVDAENVIVNLTGSNPITKSKSVFQHSLRLSCEDSK